MMALRSYIYSLPEIDSTYSINYLSLYSHDLPVAYVYAKIPQRPVWFFFC